MRNLRHYIANQAPVASIFSSVVSVIDNCSRLSATPAPRIINFPAPAQAATAAVDLTSIMSETNAPSSQYRFPTLMVRAVELVGLVKEFGRLSIDALEKKDVSVIALLLSDNETSLLEKVTDVKQKEVEEAARAYESLEKGILTFQAKRDHHQNRPLMNIWEGAYAARAWIHHPRPRRFRSPTASYSRCEARCADKYWHNNRRSCCSSLVG
ncbi:hypothetical protein BKA61DRAFT_576822 [Leptodontidium sp. MPI-SDFR-AT-0119]|nr:hypothetical protein BKA61DRAFT_576822 [Leptodontidium sp. MPI-SDFR-AT-0119]